MEPLKQKFNYSMALKKLRIEQKVQECDPPQRTGSNRSLIEAQMSGPQKEIGFYNVVSLITISDSPLSRIKDKTYNTF